MAEAEDTAEEAEAPQDEPDFTAPDAKASDSESSDDGPPLDSYWAAMLNVSKTADPLPPPKMLTKAELDERKNRERGKGEKGRKGDWKGKGYGKFGAHPYGPWGYMNMKGWKGGKRAPPRANDIGDFVAWAKDPAAEDGSRGRERSRSPRRQRDAEGLESFMSWARDERGVKEEPHPEGPGDGLNSFLAWAAEPAPEPVVAKTDEEGPVPDDEELRRALAGTIRVAKTEVAQPEEEQFAPASPIGVAVKAKDEALPPMQPPTEQSLIVPKELEEELRATEACISSKRERDSDDESGGGG